MSKPIALFCADTHLDVGAWAHKPKLRGDSRFAFEQICDLAISKEVEAVFAAGDFFDTRKPPSEVIEVVRDSLSCLAAAGIAFYFIQGQHDLALPPWLNAIHEHPQWLHRNSVQLSNSVNVYGIDWSPIERLTGQFKDIPQNTDILVMHQVWSDFMGSVVACECEFADVPVAPTLFTGDYHVTKVVNKDGSEKVRGADGQDLTVYSPGSTHLRSVDEDFEKYVMLYHEDGAWTKSQLLARLKFEYSIQNDGDLQEFPKRWATALKRMTSYAEENLPTALQQPILWLQQLETMEDARRTVEELVGEDADIFVRRVRSVDSKVAAVQAARREILDRGLVGCLELVVPKTSEQYAPLLRLLSSQDPAQELLNMRSERLDAKAKKKKRSRKKGQTEKHNHSRKSAQD